MQVTVLSLSPFFFPPCIKIWNLCTFFFFKLQPVCQLLVIRMGQLLIHMNRSYPKQTKKRNLGFPHPLIIPL